MRVALDIKNLSKLKEPSTNDVMIYDGYKWYVTTKDDILKEANVLLSKCQNELASLKKENNEFKEQICKENNEFKKQMSKDIVELTETVKKLFELKGENL